MKILAIDPGLRCTGIAIYNDTQWTVESVRVEEHDLAVRVRTIAACIRILCPSCDLLVIERPQVYQGRLQKGDPNDLIDLSVLVGALLSIPHVKALLPRPREWKGQTPKDIHHKRIRELLPNLGPVSKDAMDAVGLAIWGWDHAETM